MKRSASALIKSESRVEVISITESKFVIVYLLEYNNNYGRKMFYSTGPMFDF